MEAVAALAEGEASSAPLKLVGEEMGDDDISALRRVRRQLLGAGLISQFKFGNHFHVSLTPLGREALEAQWPAPETRTEHVMPQMPYRVGKDHLLPSPVYRKLVRWVGAGEADLVVIPRTMKTKIDYWDAP